MADCVRYKIDSNSTGLSFAEEVCSGQLPTLADDGFDPTWYGLEPNEYDDFGVSVTLAQRQPIKSNRQNLKGSPVDFDAVAGWNQDFTHSNTNRLLEGFFFSNYREQPTTNPIHGTRLDVSAATASNDRYTVGAGVIARGFRPGQLIYVSGATEAANNGLQLIDEVGDTYIGVAGSLVDETLSDDVVISVVGFEFGLEAVSVVAPSTQATFTIATPPVAAEATLTIASTFNAVADETVTIDGVVYTFKAAAANPYEVTIGGSRLSTLVNLTATINGGNLLTPDAHPTVSAVDNADGTMDIVARVKGVTGNGIPTAETMTQGAWSGDTAGGTGYSWFATGAEVGMWLYLGGDAAGSYFADNRGYGRVGSITDTALVLDKTTWAVTAEAVTGVTLRVFAGDFLRNEEDGDDVVTHYYQFERTLGRDADGVQSEYVVGSVANELTFNIETADKLTIDLGFIAADGQTRTGAEGRKTGTHVEAPGEDFYNTSSDVHRVRMSVIETGNSFPNTLFGYITEGSLSIENGVDPVKVVGAAGGIDVSTGNFTVTGEVTALFSSVLSMRAIRLTSDVTVDFIFAKQNRGYVFDIPLLGLGNGMPDITLNEPITIPLEMQAGECPAGYTLSYTTFVYLPTAAMPD